MEWFVMQHEVIKPFAQRYIVIIDSNQMTVLKEDFEGQIPCTSLAYS